MTRLADAATLRGDLRDAMLALCRTMPERWGKLTEEQQRTVAQEADDRAAALIEDVVRLVMGGGHPAVAARLRTAKVGKALQLAFDAPKETAARHLLLDAVEENLVIVVADPVKFFGESAPAAIDPDQTELPVKAGKARGAGAPKKPTGGKSAPKTPARIDPTKLFRTPAAGSAPPHDPETGEVAE